MFSATEGEIVWVLSFCLLVIQGQPTEHKRVFPLSDWAAQTRGAASTAPLLCCPSSLLALRLRYGIPPSQPCQQQLQPGCLHSANTTSAIAESTPIHFKMPANICEQRSVAFVQIPLVIKLSFETHQRLLVNSELPRGTNTLTARRKRWVQSETRPRNKQTLHKLSACLSHSLWHKKWLGPCLNWVLPKLENHA